MRRLLRRTRRSRLLDVAIFAAIILAIIAVLRFLPQPDPIRIAGHVRIIDGDSISIQGVEIRLRGIDAPERGQTCNRSGAQWSCGEHAARTLGNHLRGRIVQCIGDERDAHGRLLAICRSQGQELNRWLVEQGWAVSYHEYPAAERAARTAKRGIWSGSFVRPRDWREENR